MTIPSPATASALSAPAAPLLAALRAGTRCAHLRVEAEPKMACLLAPDLDEASYVESLRAMYAFHATVLHRLAPFVQSKQLRAPDPDVLAALAEDLHWFGAALPLPGRKPTPFRTLPAALGALYVLEGSALGGRVIGRAVATSLSVSPGRGGSFYGGLTADRARDRWRGFCAELECQGAAMDLAGFARAVAGANEAFRALERLLQTPRPGSRRSGAAPQRRAGAAVRAVPAALADPARDAARTVI